MGLGFLTLIILYKILWIKNFHNFIFWALAYQWTNVNVKTIYAPLIGSDFLSLHKFPDHIIQAWAYSNIDLIVVAIGFRLMAGKSILFSSSDVLFKIDLKKFSNYYIIFSILTLTILNPYIYSASIQQILYQFTYLKYALFFIGFSNILKHNDYKNRLNYYFIFEFLLSFSGYFSSFKDYLMIVFIVYIYVNSNKFGLKQYLFGTIAIFIGFNLGVIWCEIKIEYRTFLTKGEVIQANKRDINESLTFLYERINSIDANQYQDGIDQFIDRLEYIDYFSACIGYVPQNKPHQNGKTFSDALLYGFQPRFLFPDKEILDDSKYTSEYTGLILAGKDEATSISLGYCPDGYIDFGENLFFITPLLFGMLIGGVYKILVKKANNQLWGLAITLPLFYMINNFGNIFNKMLPPVMYYSVVAYLFLQYGLKYLKLDINNKETHFTSIA